MIHSQLKLSPESTDGNGFSAEAAGARAAVITREQLKLAPEYMTKVIPNETLRFVIPIPKMEGKPFVEPATLPDGSSNPNAGQVLKDYKGNPISGEGVVFFNFKDKNWAALKTDGSGIVIFNSINEAKADLLEGLFRTVVREPAELTPETLERFLNIAAANGFGDRYNSDAKYAAGNLVAHEDLRGAKKESIANFGLHSRTKDVLNAVYVPGEGVAYQDGTASPQISESNGLVVLLTADGKTRAVQLATFAETYRLADGTPVSDPTTQLAVQHPLLQ